MAVCNIPAVLFFILISAAASASEYKPLDIPGADQPEVARIRTDFLKPSGLKKLTGILDNAEPYRLYIRKQLAQKKMPSCLEYLPVIESEFNPSARSKDGNGVGMWQFMPNSTSPFLILNSWIDERLDPWKSTDAALSKLQDNYRQFNDWPLAIAAYNCGAGAMSRALKDAPEKTFWYLAENALIPDHTIRYVPKLLAIADLAQNSEYYGIQLPTAADDNGTSLEIRAGEFDYITVQASVPLIQLAGELRIDNQLFLQLNAALIKGITPPDMPYRIRLPAGMKTAAEQALTQIQIYTSFAVHTVKKGDTLWSLSKTYRIPVLEICRINELSDETILKIGKILYIPDNSSDKRSE